METEAVLGVLRKRKPRSPWRTRYFIDTEFTDFAPQTSCQLISVAVVGEDGREFYAECSDFSIALCSDFVRRVVLPQLGKFPDRSMRTAQLAIELAEWLSAVPLKPKPVLCYDSNVDIELVSRLLDSPLPKGWKHENVFQKIDAERFAEYISVHGGEHHALYDARANAFAFR
ncbi:3'-5' exoribonuclease [Pandoraea commovens]|uniref:3'-5' exoribonuclease n=1 Tax=Pandoraea commovens TaxID=2508289 RepID=A0ABY5QH58_9BURK|nr:3'-5' exoribonuclease [Pandoraea commovens]UVA79984.1 3'-5' exoribonuclease [Pandoraea commovens]